MNADLVSIGLAFLEGFALVISPCILPILPIILSGSLAGKRARPYGIIVGFIITFTIVTLFSRIIIGYTDVSEDTIRNVSLVILLLLGIVMISTYLTDKFTLLTQRLSNVGASLETVNNPQGGFFGGLVFGGLVGIIWTPCAGPILAAVIVQVVLQHTTLNSLLTVTAFAIGAGLPMLLIAILGRGIINRVPFIREKTALLRKVLGWIMIATVVYLYYSSGNATYFTQGSLARTEINTSGPLKLIDGVEHPYNMPEIAGIDAWINSPPLTTASLHGKVVLIDFWTYSCINCIRTLPYLKDWYAKYHDKGLEIIGIHSPEFPFEHDLNNVKNAVKTDGIEYPVALDNRFVTWQNFHNEYWPAHYLIDRDGKVVSVHFGEGEYDVTENNIRYLLGLKGSVNAQAEQAYSSTETPETYLGYDRQENYSSPEKVTYDTTAKYSYPASLTTNQWALQGDWNIQADKIVAASAGASIKLHFVAGKVYVVMGSMGHPTKIKLLLNGAVIKENQGKDVNGSSVQVSQQRLYTLLEFKNEKNGLLEMKVENPGVEIYTFTFGE